MADTARNINRLSEGFEQGERDITESRSHRPREARGRSRSED